MPVVAISTLYAGGNAAGCQGHWCWVLVDKVEDRSSQ